MIQQHLRSFFLYLPIRWIYNIYPINQNYICIKNYPNIYIYIYIMKRKPMYLIQEKKNPYYLFLYVYFYFYFLSEIYVLS